jgi:[ribosomal protein S5]-alanine N-acetyltransferase
MTTPYKTIFETDRLLLRQQVIGDLDELWAFHSNPENVRYYQNPPRTLEEVRQELEWDVVWYREHDGFGTWAIILKETRRIVGLCCLLPWTVEGIEEVEMSYILAEEVRGQGLGSELSRAVVRYGFEELGLSRIISLIEPENMLSRHVVEKTGMCVEREVQEEDGPALLYSITR